MLLPNRRSLPHYMAFPGAVILQECAVSRDWGLFFLKGPETTQDAGRLELHPGFKAVLYHLLAGVSRGASWVVVRKSQHKLRDKRSHSWCLNMRRSRKLESMVCACKNRQTSRFVQREVVVIRPQTREEPHLKTHQATDVSSCFYTVSLTKLDMKGLVVTKSHIAEGNRTKRKQRMQQWAIIFKAASSVDSSCVSMLWVCGPHTCGEVRVHWMHNVKAGCHTVVV